jgi:hypothetical protein
MQTLVGMQTRENQPYYLINNEKAPPYFILLKTKLTNSICDFYIISIK